MDLVWVFYSTRVNRALVIDFSSNTRDHVESLFMYLCEVCLSLKLWIQGIE